MIKAHGYVAQAAKKPLSPFDFERRDVGEHDVLIEISHCGICHSDIHRARDEWHDGRYPMVPGHEIVGKVTKVGAAVKKFHEGDLVGVGCMVDSCRDCAHCHANEEQFCDQVVFTYNSPEINKTTYTFGGYSNRIVVDEKYVLSLAKNADLARTAPLLCAGITTYSPLKYWKAGPGKRVGILGLGGLGHMAIKIARAMGAQVVLFTTSKHKVEDALRLGAHEVVISKDPEQMQKVANSLDLLLDTVGSDHDVNMYLATLKHDGVMVMIGMPEAAQAFHPGALINSRRKLVGSLIGGIAETQEMLDFCAKHNILSDVEIIPMQKVNEAFERVLKSDVKYRFVIDMNSLQV